MSKKLFPRALIFILLLNSTLTSYLSFSSNFHQQDLTLLWALSLLAVVWGTLIIFTLSILSKMPLIGKRAKIIYQLLSYILISIGFISWALGVNMAFILKFRMPISEEVGQNFIAQLGYSLIYIVITVLFMKGISIPVSFKDIKKDEIQ